MLEASDTAEIWKQMAGSVVVSIGNVPPGQDTSHCRDKQEPKRYVENLRSPDTQEYDIRMNNVKKPHFLCISKEQCEYVWVHNVVIIVVITAHTCIKSLLRVDYLEGIISFNP